MPDQLDELLAMLEPGSPAREPLEGWGGISVLQLYGVPKPLRRMIGILMARTEVLERQIAEILDK